MTDQERKEALEALDFISDSFQTEGRWEARMDKDSPYREAIRTIRAALTPSPIDEDVREMIVRYQSAIDHRKDVCKKYTQATRGILVDFSHLETLIRAATQSPPQYHPEEIGVERLQDISEEDAQAEGVTENPPFGWYKKEADRV